MRTRNAIRPRKTGIMLVGILLLVLGIVMAACGLMGKSQADYYARKTNLSAGEWIDYATGKTPAPELTEEDYRGRNLNASGRAKNTVLEQLQKVTGFDNIDDGQKYSPSVTSVNRNWKQLGYESMDILMEVFDGGTEYDTRFVEGYISYNESCGCDLARDMRAEYTDLVRKVKKDSEYTYKQHYSRQIIK